MLTFAEQNVSLWMEVIQRKFGGVLHVSHHHCAQGQSVLYLGLTEGDTVLQVMQCIELPLDLGVVKYSDSGSAPHWHVISVLELEQPQR